jgi:hypothetical protein
MALCGDDNAAHILVIIHEIDLNGVCMAALACLSEMYERHLTKEACLTACTKR